MTQTRTQPSAGPAYHKWWLVILATLSCSHAPVPVAPLPVPLSVEADSASRTPCTLVVQRAAAAGKHIYREAEVDRNAEPVLVNGRGPEYPNEKTEAIPATVAVQVVVDSTGTPDISSFRPVAPGQAEFLLSVREFLRTATYKPAYVGGRPVAECALQTFQFVPTYYHRAGEH